MVSDEDVGLRASDPALKSLNIYYGRADGEIAIPMSSRSCRLEIPPPEKASCRAVVYLNLGNKIECDQKWSTFIVELGGRLTPARRLPKKSSPRFSLMPNKFRHSPLPTYSDGWIGCPAPQITSCVIYAGVVVNRLRMLAMSVAAISTSYIFIKESKGNRMGTHSWPRQGGSHPRRATAGYSRSLRGSPPRIRYLCRGW